MWKHDNQQFYTSLMNQFVTFDSPKFKEALAKKGLEKNTTKIELYIPPYLNQLNIPLPYFVAAFGTFSLNQDLSDGFHFDSIPVDATMYDETRKLCKLNGLIGHEQKIASILKLGYYYYTLAEVKMKYEQLFQSQKEFRELAAMAFSGQELTAIKFSRFKTKSIEFKSPMLLEIITNSISHYLHNNLQYGAYLDAIENVESSNSLHIKYRNLLVFNLVCYLFREVGLVNVNSDGEISIPKKVGDLIAEFLELAKVPMLASNRWKTESQGLSEDDKLIRRFFTSAIEVFPMLEIFLYKGLLTDEEIEQNELDEYEKSKKVIAHFMNQFEKKRGL